MGLVSAIKHRISTMKKCLDGIGCAPITPVAGSDLDPVVKWTQERQVRELASGAGLILWPHGMDVDLAER